MNFLRRTPSMDPDASHHHHHRGHRGKANSSNIMSSRDPPSAASIVLSDSAPPPPTFLLNARQMEILANRQQQQQQQQQQNHRGGDGVTSDVMSKTTSNPQQQQQQGPFATKSNQNGAAAAQENNDKRQQQQPGSYDRYDVPGAGAGAASVVGSTATTSTTTTARTAPTDQRTGHVSSSRISKTQSDTAKQQQQDEEQQAFLRNILGKAATTAAAPSAVASSSATTTSDNLLQQPATMTTATTTTSSSMNSASAALDQKAILRRVLKRTEKTLHNTKSDSSSKHSKNKKSYIPIMATPPPPSSSVSDNSISPVVVERTDTATTHTDSSIMSESAASHHHLSKSGSSSSSGGGTWGTTVNGLRERLRMVNKPTPTSSTTSCSGSLYQSGGGSLELLDDGKGNSESPRKMRQRSRKQQAKQQSAASLSSSAAAAAASSEQLKILADIIGGGKKKPSSSTTTTTREERKVLSEILSSKKREAGPAAVSEERRLLKELLARSKNKTISVAAPVKRTTATAATRPNPYASLGRSMEEEEEKKEEEPLVIMEPSFDDDDDDDARLQQLPPKARLAEMRKRLEKQKMAAAGAASKTATAPSSLTMTRDPPPTKVKTLREDADLEGYENFFKTLQLEVSGQHSQLWESFSAVLDGRPTPPLVAVPPPTKSFKFDPETKLMLTKMNGYLKDYAPVECKTQTQLVNDKKLAKQIASGSLPAPLIDLRSAGPLSLSTTSKPEESVASATIADKRSDAVLRMRSSTSTSSAASSHSSTVASPGRQQLHQQQQHRFFAFPYRQQPEEEAKQIVTSAPPLPRHDESENTVAVANPTTLAGLEQASSTDSIGSSRNRSPGETDSRGLLGCATWSGRSSSKTATPVVGVSTVTAAAQEKKGKASIVSSTLTETGCASDFENQSDPGLEVTLGQFVSKTSTVTTSRSSTPSEAGSVSSSYSRLQLKSVKSFSSSHVDNTNLSPSTNGGGLPPAWATVRLRKVDVPPEPNNNHGQKQDDASALLPPPPPPPPPPPIQDPIEMNRSSSTAAAAASSRSGTTSVTQMQADVHSSDGTAVSSKIYGEAILSMESADNETATSTRREQTRLLETIDGSNGQTVTANFNSKTVDAAVSDEDGRVRDKIDEAVVVRLKQSPGTPKSVEMRVIIGKKMLMMVRGKAGLAEATVLWKLPRSEAGALTLDMASHQAKLMVKDKTEEKILFFSCPEDCLKFANAFYEMEIPRSPKESNDDSFAETDAGDDDDGDAEFASLRLERLNNEEQAVLDTYRRLRKNKPAGDALQETISQEGSINGDMLLTPEENDIADKYRKMLKVSIPLDAVKHKMLRDDVHAKIIEVVVTEAENTPPRVVSTEPMPSSPISTFSNPILLSPQELLLAENFKKMLRLQIPAEAVRLEMKKQNIDAKIVEFVLGEDVSINSLGMASTTMNLTEAEKLAVATYEKMLKMCIPADAVRHKMKQDQADVKIVEAVFGKGSFEDYSNVPAGSTNKLSKEEDEIAAKYRHMLKMHIPREAVEHKMTKEGASQKIMSAVLGTGSAIPAPMITGLKANKKKELTPDELSIASQFKKMLKLQIPRDKVLERMQQKNIDEKIVAFVLGKSPQAMTGDENSKSSNKNSSKLVSLHWTPLSGKELDNSVWKAAGNRKVAIAEPEGNDISKLVELFQKKTNKAATKEKKAATNSDTSEKAKLLDLNRSNNIAISLKAFKDFEYAELAEIIMHLDPMRKIQGERVHFLRDLLPTQTEIKIIKSYDGGPSRLVPAELWFQSIADIKRIEVKVQVLRTMEMLKVEAKSIGENLRLLTLVCNQVMDSEKLQDLLGMVLRIGNIMNEGTRTGGAAGFKFDSLLKLTQTKSSDGKTTVLDYLVTVFVAKNKRETLDLTSEFPECQTASRMLVSDLVAEVKSIQESLEQCKEELAALEEDAIGRKAGRFAALQAKTSDLSSQSSTVSDSRAGLLASIQSRQSIVDIPDRDAVSDPSCRNIELPVNAEALLADSANEKSTNASSVADLLKSATSQMEQASQGCSRRRLSAMNGNSGVFGAISRIESVSKNNVHAAVVRLREFITESDLLVEKLVSEKDETMAASRELARYCGESAGPGATSILLGILSGFASSLEQALKKHDQKRLAEEKRKKRREEERAAAQAKGPLNAVVESVDSSESEETGASLVLMVNQMLKDANPRAKEDFKKGRVSHNPSQTLQKIYETEQKVIGSKSHNRKLDLVSAIQERSDEVDQGEVQIARSKFGSPLATEDAGDTNMFRDSKGNSSNRVRPRPENAEHRNVVHTENTQRNVSSERPNPKPEGPRQKPSPDGFQRKQSLPNPEMSRPAPNKSSPTPPSYTIKQPTSSPPEEIEATTTYKTLRERIKSFASRNAADANQPDAAVGKSSSPPAAKKVENSQEEKADNEEKRLSAASDEKTEESAKVDVPETLDEPKAQDPQLDHPQFDISGSSHRLSLNGIATPERQIHKASSAIQRLEQSRVVSEVKIIGLASSMTTDNKDPDLIIASPPRIPSTSKSDNPKSLRELAMEKRQQRNSLGNASKLGEDQDVSFDSKGESSEQTAGNASGESTVARMARIKREEKAQQKQAAVTTKSATAQPLPTNGTTRGQSLVKGLVQMAREKREAKKNTPT